MRKLKKLSLAGAAAGIVAAGAALGMAFASALTLTAPIAPSVTLSSKCSTDDAVVTIDAGVASVVTPAACEGENLALVLGHGQTASIVSVPSGGSVSLPGSLTQPQGVLVTSDTWPLSTDWTIQDLPDPDPETAPFTCSVPNGTCEVTDINLNSWGWPSTNEYNISGTIVSSSPTHQQWTLTINLSSPDLPFVANSLRDAQGGLVKSSDSGCAASERTVTVTGTTTWGDYHLIWDGQSRNFQVNGKLATGTGGLLSCP